MLKICLTCICITLLFAGGAVAQNSSKDFVAVKVADKVMPSLVAVEALNVVHTELRFFGAARQQAISATIGTGVIVDTQGHILCKNNVVEDSKLVRITLYDGTKRDGEVLVRDPYYDVALLKIDTKGLRLVPVVVGDPSKSIPGDSAVCVGNSAGYNGTVTYGIVSARRDYRTPMLVLVPNMIQADCAINAGNTGAPLFNWKGEMIGFHNNVGAVRGDSANINFFMPSDLVMRLAREMIKTGKRAFRPYVGILPFARIDQVQGAWQTMGDDIRMYFDLPEEYWDVGVLVENIDNSSPAYEFGLAKGDLIIRVETSSGNEILVKSVGQLEKLIQGWKDGQVVTFHVLRENLVRKVSLEVGPAPEETPRYYM